MVNKQDALANSHDPEVSDPTLIGTEVTQAGDQSMEQGSGLPPDLPPGWDYQKLAQENQPPSPGVSGTFDAGRLLKAHSEYRREQTMYLNSEKKRDDVVRYHYAKDRLIEAMDEALQTLGVL